MEGLGEGEGRSLENSFGEILRERKSVVVHMGCDEGGGTIRRLRGMGREYL